MNAWYLTIPWPSALPLPMTLASFAKMEPVPCGMSLPQLNAMLHEKLPLPPAKDDQACFYVTTKKQPKVSFMMLEGRLARIDVRDPGVTTTTGIQVGDSEKHALQVTAAG
jgi:hypothetical protein